MNQVRPKIMEPNENKIRVSVNVNQRLVKKVELSSSDSIAAAKQKLIDSLGAASRLSKVNLIFGGKVLANDQLVRVGILAKISVSV